MTPLRLVPTLFLLVVATTQAAFLRTKDSDALTSQSDPVSPSHSAFDSISDSAEDVTRDSSTSHGSHESKRVVVGDKVDGVKAWAQCGGLYYLGETKCQQYTSCKQLSDFISVCFPESRPTEQIVRLEL